MSDLNRRVICGLVAGGLLAAGIAMSGCENSRVNRVETRSPGGSNVGFDRVILNQQLENRVRAIQLIATDENGAMFVQATLENTTGSEQTIRFVWQWLDDRGIELDPSSQQWATRVIEAGGILNVQGVATDGRATDFRLLLAKGE